MSYDEALSPIIAEQVEAIVAPLRDEIVRLREDLAKVKGGMTDEYIVGDKALADFLHTSVTTITRMNKVGKLDDARYKVGIHNNCYNKKRVMELMKY